MKRSLPPVDEESIEPRQTRSSARLRHNRETQDIIDFGMGPGSQDNIDPSTTTTSLKKSPAKAPARGRKKKSQSDDDDNDPMRLVAPLMPIQVNPALAQQPGSIAHNNNPHVNQVDNSHNFLEIAPAKGKKAAPKKATKATSAAANRPRYQPIPVNDGVHIKFVPPVYHNGIIPPSTVHEIVDCLNPFPITQQSQLTVFGSCTLCLQKYVVNDMIIMAPCLHNFHADCITEWFQHKHEEGLREFTAPLKTKIQEYWHAIEDFNAQFAKRYEYIYDANSGQSTALYRDPTNAEIAMFRPPPPVPYLSHPQRIECAIQCPTCWCDWKQLIMSANDDDNFHMGDD